MSLTHKSGRELGREERRGEERGVDMGGKERDREYRGMRRKRTRGGGREG